TGPLEIRAYAPAIDMERARLVGCGDGAPPAQAPPDPLAYGTGAPPRPEWPCAEPVVRVEVAAPPEGTTLRVFARVDGAGRVLELAAEPPATPLPAAGAGTGVGLELAPGPATLRVRLAIDG